MENFPEPDDHRSYLESTAGDAQLGLDQCGAVRHGRCREVAGPRTEMI